jgi:signal transduction histidine kinase/ligand-binding sensor domain-containing protein
LIAPQAEGADWAMLRILLAVSTLVLFLFSAASADAEYQVDSWTTENGLPQNAVSNVCQTEQGYLWLATLDGLVRFDGVRFVVFDRSNTPGISGNRFTSIYCTDDGFWAPSETSGVTRYHRGKFTTYTTQQGLPSDEVLGITGDNAGRIWMFVQHSIVEWRANESRFALLTSEPSIYTNADRRFGFWGVHGDKLRLFVHGRSEQYRLPTNFLESNITGAAWDLNGTFWLASLNGAIVQLNHGRWTVAGRITSKGSLDADPARLLSNYRDSRGQDWPIGMEYKPGVGLKQYLRIVSSGRLLKLPFDAYFEDREGSAWVATGGQGLYRIRKQTIRTLSIEDGLPSSNIYPIFQDRTGVIWIGTWGGGVARYAEGKLTTFSGKDGLTSGVITSIYMDHQGVLWVGTEAGRLFKMRDRRFEQVHPPLLSEHAVVRAIQEDSEGALWFGTDQGLLSLKRGVWHLDTTKDGLAADNVSVIVDSRAGTLWVGSYGGLTRIQKGRFKHWTEADGLPSNSIRSLYQDTEGVLWIGTYDGGLARFQNGQFTRYTMRDGLFNNGVFQILEDSRGYLWMSCNRGIYRVLKRGLTEFAMGKQEAIDSIAYGKSDGMRSEECNGGVSPAGIRARDGKLWFPTQNGVAIIDPDSVTTNLTPPPIVIESAAIDNEDQRLTGQIRIPPGKENLEIRYTAPSLINSDRIRFRYKLEDLDRDWVQAGTRRVAYYSHLPPGHYIFDVTAANSDGLWNNDGQSLPVMVLPPFYRTWWFITGALLVTAAVVVLAWKYRVAQLTHANELQHAFSRELIASQERERKRIAAELHDSLGQHLVVIKNLALLSLDKEIRDQASRPRIEEICDEAAQALSEVREISYNLRPYQLDRIGLTKAIEAVVKRAADATTIKFHTEIDSIDAVLDADSEINFYRIVQECLNNVLKHSQATDAGILVRRSATRLLLSVQDNGKGFTPDGAMRRDGAQPGFGLFGIAERAQLLAGKMSSRSAPGQGTTITVEIPLSENYDGA